MPTKKIDKELKICLHPDHLPPAQMVYTPGRYEHICSGCGAKTYFTVNGVSW